MKPPKARILTDEEIVILLTDVKAFEEAPPNQKAFIANRLREYPDLVLQVHDISLVLIPLIQARAKQEAKPNVIVTLLHSIVKKISIAFEWIVNFFEDPFRAFYLSIFWVIFFGVLALILKALVVFIFFLFSLL